MSSSPPPSSSSPSSNSSSSSPPPPDSSSTSSPPPPSSPPPSSSPPPPNNSPPPPSGNNNKSPPSDDNNSPPPHSNDGGNNKSPPPPKSPGSSDGNSFSPPPPPAPSQNSGSPGLPTPRDRSPPSSSNSPSNNDSSSNNQRDIIAGAAAGAGLLLLIMIVFLISCARRKKRRQRDNMYFYDNNSHGNKTGGYYDNGPAHGNWKNNDRPFLPPSHGNANMSSEQGWLGAPPPHPPMMSSSELSSSGFSGPRQAALPPPHPAMALGFNQSSFTYDDLAVATGNFSQSNLLGQGGFGFVHKGLLPNGKEIAVKSLKSNSAQGEREFQAEVDIISRVHHRHLVSLVGYCIAGSQRMLVYEYVPNGNLEYHLYGAGRPSMDWQTRLKIAMGSAKGFAYLHEDCHPRIIHRDIKAANILLDYNFDAKVADFGLAKLSSDNNTHVSTRIMGTFGYLAPEYASSGKLTEKSDVYSFGIMLLELITGRRPIDLSSDDDSLVDWARPILIQAVEGGSFEELVDPRLENNYDPQVMLRMVASAAACIRHSARRRPKMSQIVRALEGDVSLEDLNQGVRAGHNGMFGSSGGSEYNDIGSYPDMKRYRNAGAVSSQEFASSGEHGTNTGEFVHSRETTPNRP